MIASCSGKLDDEHIFRLRPSKSSHDDPGPPDAPPSSHNNQSRGSTGGNSKKRKRVSQEGPASTQSSPARASRPKKHRRGVLPEQEVQESGPSAAAVAAKSSKPKPRKYSGKPGADIFTASFTNWDRHLLPATQDLPLDSPPDAMDVGFGAMDVVDDVDMNNAEDDLPGEIDLFDPRNTDATGNSKGSRKNWGPRAGLKSLPTDDEEAEGGEPMVSSEPPKKMRRPPTRVPSSESEAEQPDSAPSAAKIRAPGPPKKPTQTSTATSKAVPKPPSKLPAIAGNGTADIRTPKATLPTKTLPVAKDVDHERAVACYLIHPQFMPSDRNRNPETKLSKEEVRVSSRSRSDDISH